MKRMKITRKSGTLVSTNPQVFVEDKAEAPGQPIPVVPDPAEQLERIRGEVEAWKDGIKGHYETMLAITLILG